MSFLNEKKYDPEDPTCFTHVTVFDLFTTCGTHSPLAHIAGVITTVIGPFILTTAVLGAFGNIILMGLLLAYIRHPRNLNMFGIVLLLLDLIRLVAYGIIDLVPAFGTPMWSSPHSRLDYGSHLVCKLVKSTRAFLCTAQQNVVVCTALTELSYTKQAGSLLWNLKLILMLIIALTLAVVQAGPVFLQNGLWQHHGMFICAPDPQWSRAYHKFLVYHELLFVDGLLQILCVLPLTCLLCKRLARENRIIKCLQRTLLSRNIISLMVFSVETKLIDSCRNLRITLSFMSSTLLLGILRCVFRAYQNNYSRGQPIDAEPEYINPMRTFQRLIVLLEIICSSTSYVWWLVNLPMYNAFLTNTRDVINRREDRQSMSDSQKSTKTLCQAVQQPSREKIMKPNYPRILNQLYRLGEHLIAQHAEKLGRIDLSSNVQPGLWKNKDVRAEENIDSSSDIHPR
ncbi:hypothetical protein CRM22_009612 [Opisthorchis felineus]|uniref:G-protein coupled receptors family 1 profile domain-containing protein n=1 Tax=Opisthorchis felineus TaxID=147828 RepID=A0A4S2L6Z7_OPIFE|nr:hypothetical protein CRM22_009612 [Opisthorchis felineus]